MQDGTAVLALTNWGLIKNNRHIAENVSKRNFLNENHCTLFIIS